MEGHMPRSGASLNLGERRIIRSERSGTCVESIADQFIESKVSRNGKAVVASGLDPMGVRSFLTFLIGSRSIVLHEGRSRAQSSIGSNGKNRNTSTRIVRDQYVLA